MLLVAASRKLADAGLSMLIEWPPCYSFETDGFVKRHYDESHSILKLSTF